MSVTRVMSLVAATVFALGVVGPAVAQTPPTLAPAKTGDAQMEKDKKPGKAAKHGKKKQAKKHAKKAEGDQAPAAKAPEQPKK